MGDTVASRLEAVRERIEKAAREAGRDPGSVRLLAVSKTFGPECVREALAAGQLLFGENRVQEAVGKVSRVGAPEAEWHLIGPLQSNKARPALQTFQVIQTVDRPKIARRLDQLAQQMERRVPVFVQVNVGEESQKHGVPPAQVTQMVHLVDGLAHLDLCGLMAIPPFSEDPEDSRPHFRRLADLLKELNRERRHPLRELSMGMSHDFEVAIQEGATLVRLGSAIFGPRGR